MNEELTNLLEGIETANNIKQYDEGLADVVKGAGRAIANVFGTKAGAAQRNQAAAQQKLQTAQANQQTQQVKNQTNALDDITLAKNLNDIVTKALKIAGDGLTNAQNQQMQKNADKGEQEAVKNGATSDNKTPANQDGTPVDGANRETSTNVPEGGGKQ